jgi:hypothetical protein
MMNAKLTAKLEACEASLKRNHTRLVRITNKLTKLTRERQRLLRQLAAPEPKPTPAKPEPRPVSDVTNISMAEMRGDDLRTPAFLDRSNPLIAEEMTRARKAAEAAERSKMPLTGRAAREAIMAIPVRPKRKVKA